MKQNGILDHEHRPPGGCNLSDDCPTKGEKLLKVIKMNLTASGSCEGEELDFNGHSCDLCLKMVQEADVDNVRDVRCEKCKLDGRLFASDIGNESLFEAAKKGNLETVQTILDLNNIDINFKDWHGRTALGWAAFKGHVNVVQALVNHKDIQVNVAENHNSTPIGTAAEFGHDKVVELLVDRTSTEFINKADNDGDFPLQTAVHFGHERVVEVLLRHPGIDLGKRDIRTNRTPLEWAREKGNKRMIKMLEDA